MAPVSFWQAPGTWIHYMARRKPALFWSVVVGSLGPVTMVNRAEQSQIWRKADCTYRSLCRPSDTAWAMARETRFLSHIRVRRARTSRQSERGAY